MRVGLYNGCFDKLHEGHKHALSQAVRQCDYLILAVNTDSSVKRLKGKDRPIQPLNDRISALCGLADSVIPFDGDLDKLIMGIKPDILFVGYDHRAPLKIGWYSRDWKNNRESGAGFAQVIQLPHLLGYSTTAILKACEDQKVSPAMNALPKDGEATHPT